MKKIYCERCGGVGCMALACCPTCHGDGYTLQSCSNCQYQDGKIGGTAIDMKDGEIVETDATQYHCAHHEQYLPAGITCEEWRAKA